MKAYEIVKGANKLREYEKGKRGMNEYKEETTICLNRGKYNIEKWDAYLNSVHERMKCKDNFYRTKLKEFMVEYAKENAKELKNAYLNYKEAISVEFVEEHYDLLDESNLKEVLKNCKVMIITANQIEKAVLHYCIINNKGENKWEKIKRVIYGTNAYFIFKWGKYQIAHIHQPQTGSYKDLGLHTTVCEALKYFKPNVILSLGVAFGIDYETQNIGDVIVSKKLFPYSANKRDEERIKPDRSQDKVVDDWLDVRLKNANGFLDGVTYGGILSGESVMSSFSEKDKVCTAYSKNDYVVGGEMEGCALFQVSNSTGIPCAVIKGICDWGVAKNDIFPENPVLEEKFKDSLQAYAMKMVVDKCGALFRDRTLFNISKTKDLEVEKGKNKVLFVSNFISNIFIIIMGILSLLMGNGEEKILVMGLSLISYSIFNFEIVFGYILRKQYGMNKNSN